MGLTSATGRQMKYGWLLAGLFFATALQAQTTPPEEALLRKPVGFGAYEMAYSTSQQALFLATSQTRSKDKGGIVYRLDPGSLAITQIIHNDSKPFGAAINTKTDVLFFGNTTDSALTAIDAKTGAVKGRLTLDARPRSEDVRPLAPRELVVDADNNTVYVSGLGPESVIWVVDGDTLTLRATISKLGKTATGLALDAAAHRLYVTNMDGEFLTIDTSSNEIVSRKKLDEAKPHSFLNISLDPATHRAFISDAKQPELLVVDTRNGSVLKKIAIPESLAVLFNPARNEIYTTHRQAGEVTIIDGKTYQPASKIKLPVHPNSLLLSPDGQVLYVSVKQPSSRQAEATQPDDVVRIALK